MPWIPQTIISNEPTWLEVVKTADESVSNTTFQDDDELQFTTVSGAIYDIQMVLIYASPAGAGTPDFKTQAGEDATNRGVQNWIGLSAAADAPTDFITQSALAGAGGWGTATTDRAVKMTGVHTGNGGSWKLQWAQNTSNANATIVRAGSLLRYRRIM